MGMHGLHLAQIQTSDTACSNELWDKSTYMYMYIVHVYIHVHVYVDVQCIYSRLAKDELHLHSTYIRHCL